MGELLDHLCKLNQSDIYPFHMPGHKRRRPEGISLDLFGMDITEIDGFDNLHHPTGILKETQEGAAELYGVLQTFFLVNGSTCGIQAAISASVRAGKKLLLARNCHKSVYNTCLLRSIDTTYVYPVRTQMEEVLGEIRAEDVKAALDADADIDAVIITSPNYDGVISDVERIADVVHEKGKLLIVDEAHGAHLPFADDFPKSAIRCGADIVIQSLHKTLPAPTQTALLHVASSRVDTAGLREFLAIYQTSSPSYVFMAAMQHCIEATYAHRKEWFETLSGRLDGLAAACADLHSLKLFSGFGQKPPGMYAHDKSKILI
ncbi:MAG: aminotransferase class V-fold PLP-dependent enzyme, partial [Lachnospiraceae bacterium]|nr:aminotransferase class V-fold PLP-dependent enzyme [Lachnospiraceae bacterium]